jgi:ribonuclease D
MPAALPPVDLERLAADARAGGRLGIDTEFMTEGRYHPLLCLVQVSVADPTAEDGVRVELIDPLAGDDDPAPLAAILADPGVEVVLHAARQDVALLRRVWQTEVTPVFDTQVAAGFAGFSAQAGYTNLLGETLGLHLPKSAGFTRWDVRPLTDEQLEYAKADVLYLLELADHLRERLEDRGRLGWVRDECRPLESSSDQRDPWETWRRLPKSNQLSGRARAVARELAAWREQTAAHEDRTVSSVVSDPALVEIARRQPADEKALAGIRGVHGGVLRRRGRDVLAAVRRGLDAPPVPKEREGAIGLEAHDGPVIALAEAMLRRRALDERLAYEVLATRAELNRVVAATRRGDPEPDVRILTGWRRQVAGDDLLALLRGERDLAVDEQGRLAVRMDGAGPG